MIRQDVLESENYFSLFDGTIELSSQVISYLDSEAEDGVWPIKIYEPQARLISDIDPERFLETISFAGRLCWDRDWKKGPDRFVRNIIDQEHLSVTEHGDGLHFLVLTSRSSSQQSTRHRIGFSPTQMSQRYIRYDDASKPAPICLRHNRTDDEEIYNVETAVFCVNQYRVATKYSGIKPEDAREMLPNSMATIFMVTMNTRSLRHYLSLRMAKHAQDNVRAIANDMYDQMVDVGLGVIVEDFEPLKAYDPR